MSDEKVELYCEYDPDEQIWVVFFPHPLGGRNVLETFDNEADARAFWQDQIDSDDYDSE
jgi:hypothetical protein